MRKTFLLLTFLSLVILSCKKETAKNNSETPETPCVCLKENIGIAFPDTVSCYGFLTMTEYVLYTLEKPISYVSTKAFFTGIADFQENGNAIVKVDSVSLNQQSLMAVKDVNGNHMYYDNHYITYPAQQEWRIFGANGIPSFTYTADLKTPTADFSMIPDNINKSLVKSFKINSVSNITGGYVSIFSSGQSGVNVSVILRAGSNEVCFPADQLKLISSGKATVMIELENTMKKNFSTKNFAFSKKLQYSKTINLND